MLVDYDREFWGEEPVSVRELHLRHALNSIKRGGREDKEAGRQFPVKRERKKQTNEH